MKLPNKLLWSILSVLVIVTVVISICRYMKSVESFTSSPKPCHFVTLGSYNLTTAPITATSAKGLIHISSISATPSISDWANLTHPVANDVTFTYTDFSPLDLNGINVKEAINAAMTCNKIPEFSKAAGINSSPALILCLQSYTDAIPAGTGGVPAAIPAVISRVFFVKCFVPLTSLPVANSNTIVGEIAGNKIATYNYPSGPLPVAVLQGATGVPSLTKTYTLSYTICPAGNRPQGFLYTDCCSDIDPAKPIISYPAGTAELITNCLSDQPQGATCTTGTQCSSGTCTNNICAPSVSKGSTLGQSCALTSDCQTGLTCSNNVCRQPMSAYCSKNPSSFDPANGMPCSKQVATYSDVLSVGKNPIGNACTLDSDCLTGLKCSDNKCSQPLSAFCIRNPDAFDPANGVACSSEVLTYSTDTKPRYHEESVYDYDAWKYGEEKSRDGDAGSSGWGLSGWGSGWGSGDKSGDKSGRSEKSSKWSGDGNRWRGSDKDEADQLENMRPQRFNSGSIVDMSTMQPSLTTCNKYYNCKKQSDMDDDSCEGFTSLTGVKKAK